MTTRNARISRKTGETEVTLTLALDGTGQGKVQTGVGFLDHMLLAWAKHGLFDLELKATGDLYIDEHHTVEDVGICLGQALNQALGERRGLVRTSHSYVPLDESLALVVVDLSGRPYCVVEAAFSTPKVGQLGTDLVAHLLESIAIHGKFNLHVKVLSGNNDHHKIEAIFKAFGRALDAASSLDDRLLGIVPSTKGVL